MQWCFLALGSVGSSHLCPLCRVPERIAGCAVGTRYWSIVLGSLLVEREINRCGFRKSFSRDDNDRRSTHTPGEGSRPRCKKRGPARNGTSQSADLSAARFANT